MRIVDVTTSDTGGGARNLARAINTHYEGIHESRSFVRAVNYLEYPHDVLLEPEWIVKGFPDWIIDYFKTADILHYHNKTRNVKGWPSTSKTAGHIITQHGRYPTSTSVKMLQEGDEDCKRIRLVSTLNLLRYVNYNPDRWMPQTIDADYLMRVKKRYGSNNTGIFTVMHSPTNRKLKHTELYSKLMNRIKQEIDIPLSKYIIENTTYGKTQILRSQSNLCYDQLLLQHGNNGLESMAMGIPVIAGCDDRTYRTIMDVVGYLPFIRANEKNFYQVLKDTILDEDLRKEYGEIGRRYIREWHHPKVTSARAIKIYREAIELKR